MARGARWARMLLIAVAGALAPAGAALADDAPRYRLADLGPTTFAPRAIGDDGTVVGTTSTGTAPAVWRDGRFIPLPLGGQQVCQVADINATGMMGGACSTGNKTFGATWQMMSDGTITGPVILPGLGHPTYTFATVNSVASDGTLGGEADEPNPTLPSGSGAAPWRRAVVWRAGDNAIRRLDATSWGESESASVYGVNARRMAVGRTGVTAITGRSWTLNPDATPAGRTDTDIDIGSSLPHMLNDAGTVVGVRLPARTNGVIRHVDGTTIDTGTFRPGSINQAGATVGVRDGKFAAYRGVDGVVRDVATLLGDPPAGWTFDEATDLNERGDIVGYGKLGGVRHGYVLQRVPDGLKASVDPAGDAVGDTFGITINAINTNPDPLTALTFPSGMGVARDDSAGGTPIGLQALTAPTPAWPGTLAPGATGGALAAFEVTSPGTTRLVARVTGKDPTGHIQTATASLRVTAELRPMTPWEARQSVAGAFGRLVDRVREARTKALTKAVDRMRKTLSKSKRGGAKGLLKASRFEKGLAQSQGLPPNTLSILSAAIKDRRDHEIVPRQASRTELAMIFAERSETAFLKQVEKSVNSVSDKVVVTPALFWRDYARGLYNGQEAAINAEIADAAGEVYTKGSGMLAEARRFYGSQEELKAAWTELPKIYDETAAKVAELEDASEKRILHWDATMTKDPRKGIGQFADLLGDIEGQVVGGALEDVFAPQELASKTLSVLRRGKKAGDLEDVVDAVVPPGGTERLAEKGATLVTRDGDVARTPIPGMGNLNPDQLDFLSATTKRLNQKFGVRGEIQVRPINAYSANIRDGIGKVEAVPTKNLTPDDVLMGAPEEWLGQTAYY
ncbi:MAG TPA: hypothetical protein VNT55_11020, partial [Baekduia sp.]|nr:hypothetical protein [Baekduia sp.]